MKPLPWLASVLRREISISIGTSSARWSGCSPLAATGSRVPGRRRADRFICAAWFIRPGWRWLILRSALRVSGPGAELLTHPAPALAYRDFLAGHGLSATAERVTQYLRRSHAGDSQELAGPVGERNIYLLKPRGRVAALAQDLSAILAQIGAVLATGNVAVIESVNPAARLLAELPPEVAARLLTVPDWRQADKVAAILYAGEREGLRAVNQAAALRDGPIISVQGATVAGLIDGSEDYALEQLLEEVSISTNTAAAGGNANLMTIG